MGEANEDADIPGQMVLEDQMYTDGFDQQTNLELTKGFLVLTKFASTEEEVEIPQNIAVTSDAPKLFTNAREDLQEMDFSDTRTPEPGVRKRCLNANLKFVSDHIHRTTKEVTPLADGKQLVRQGETSAILDRNCDAQKAREVADAVAQINKQEPIPKSISAIVLEESFYSEYRKVYDEEGKEQKPPLNQHISCPECFTHLKLDQLAFHMIERHYFEKGQPNLCLHCLVVFSNSEELNDHIKLVNDFTAFKYTCLICCLNFKVDEDRLKHLYEKHFIECMPYVCNLCDYRSSTAFCFAQHMIETHKRVHCPYCLIPFTNRPAIHHDCSPHCDDQSDADNTKLDDEMGRHFSRHFLYKRFHGCTECSLCFLSRADLDEHTEIGHTRMNRAVEVANESRMRLYKLNLTQEEWGKFSCYSYGKFVNEFAYRKGYPIRNEGPMRLVKCPEEEEEDKVVETLQSLQLNSNDVALQEDGGEYGEYGDYDEEYEYDEEYDTPFDPNYKMYLEPDWKHKYDRLFYQSHLLRLPSIVPKQWATFPIANHRFSLRCFECDSVVVSKKRNLELSDHLVLKRQSDCPFIDCHYSARCHKSAKYHMHGLGTRTAPPLNIAPSYQPNKLVFHLSMCVTCGLRSNTAQELVYHLHQNNNHIGFSRETDPPDEEEQEQLRVIEERERVRIEHERAVRLEKEEAHKRGGKKGPAAKGKKEESQQQPEPKAPESPQEEAVSPDKDEKEPESQQQSEPMDPKSPNKEAESQPEAASSNESPKESPESPPNPPVVSTRAKEGSERTTRKGSKQTEPAKVPEPAKLPVPEPEPVPESVKGPESAKVPDEIFKKPLKPAPRKRVEDEEPIKRGRDGKGRFRGGPEEQQAAAAPQQSRKKSRRGHELGKLAYFERQPRSKTRSTDELAKATKRLRVR